MTCSELLRPCFWKVGAKNDNRWKWLLPAIINKWCLVTDSTRDWMSKLMKMYRKCLICKTKWCNWSFKTPKPSLAIVAYGWLKNIRSSFCCQANTYIIFRNSLKKNTLCHVPIYFKYDSYTNHKVRVVNIL